MGLSDYTFREADEKDYEGIEELFADNKYSPKPHSGWTSWKYLQNPDGAARVFIAESRSSAIAGTLAYLPRQFASAKTGRLMVMQVVDVFISPELRKRGVFLKLLDYARKRTDVPKIGVPNESSAVFGTRRGWRALGPHETWQFPVSFGALAVEKRLSFMAPVADLVSSGYERFWLSGPPRNLEMRAVVRFQTGYELDPAIIHGNRSAEFLNWRFIDNPVGRYSCYEFYDEGVPIGYCVYARVGKSAVLSDFIATRRQRACLHLVVNHCREAGMRDLSFSGAGLRLRKLGFLHRSVDGDCSAYKAPAGQWLITRCDIDSELDRTPRRGGSA